MSVLKRKETERNENKRRKIRREYNDRYESFKNVENKMKNS